MNSDDPYHVAVAAFEQWANERQSTLTYRQPFRRAFVAGFDAGYGGAQGHSCSTCCSMGIWNHYAAARPHAISQRKQRFTLLIKNGVP
jgi:hypothetical protein